MRLKDYEIASIKDIILKFDKNAKIYLFGSRAFDTKKGGDIDLLILSKKLKYDEKIKIKLDLYKKIGEQKIDLIISKDTSSSFIKIALKEGVLL